MKIQKCKCHARRQHRIKWDRIALTAADRERAAHAFASFERVFTLMVHAACTIAQRASAA
jgi:hypothetical protein